MVALRRRSTDNVVYGGIEAGGTKFVCLVGSGPDNVQAEISFRPPHPKKPLAELSPFSLGIEENVG
jgi:fructokinase